MPLHCLINSPRGFVRFALDTDALRRGVTAAIHPVRRERRGK